MAAAFDPDTGILTAPRRVIEALARFATGAGPVDEDRLDAVLRAAGAGGLREPHPALAPALLALRRPIVGIQLGKTGYGMPGWIGENVFAIHLYRDLDADADQLVSTPADRVWHFLLVLLDIGPRPRGERPGEIRVEAAALERAVALRLGDRPSRGLLPEPLDAAVAERFRDWWTVTSRWPAAPGRPGRYAIEAIDTHDGLWSVQRLEDGGAIVRAVTPASTLLALADLVPDGDLVDAAAPRLPVEETPVSGGPVAFVAEVLGPA